MNGLRDLRVVDFSTHIAGPYATKLFADAGADVVKVEGPDGDPLRRWSATGADLGGRDSALFQFLHTSKRSVVGDPTDAPVEALVAGANLVVESFAPGVIDALDLPARHPGLVLLSISPFGRGGPYSHRPSTEFTIQADCGSIGTRGLPGKEPFQAGGRITEWVGGTYAAVGALAAVHRARRTGHGEHVDFSLLEVMNLAGTNYLDTLYGLLGRPPLSGSAQSVESPSIEPTADGYVGFTTNSAQQVANFMRLIERPDLLEDAALFQVAGRVGRLDEWNEAVHAFTTQHSTAEIVERASKLRIPVAPINNGDTVRFHEQLVARGAIVPNPSDDFRQPRPPYKVDGADPPAFRPAPALGEHTGQVEARERPAVLPTGPAALPLDGLRVVDTTAWWAGPSASQMLAFLGADVIHVESTQRMDGMRSTGALFRESAERWWEHSFFFLAVNTNKRGLTLNLTDPRGVDLAKRLIATADAVVENFTPRVLPSFGLDWETLRAINPNLIMIRMPAFGLSGPWRDHTGFAQTMEQMTGLAWLTGHTDDQPRIQRGPCDPLAGMHAVFAFLVALAERETKGSGVHVECAMVEGALNAAAEQLIEFTAYGNLLHREGNRSPAAAPQGLYPCRGHDPVEDPRWLALSIETDAQWEALVAGLGRPAWATPEDLATLAGRRENHDRIDAELSPWIAARDRDELIAELVAAGIPAAPVFDPRATHTHPQLAARGYYEEFEHEDVGTQIVPTVPFRYASVRNWIRRPAPRLGEHNAEILGGELGLSADEIAKLMEDGVIGERPTSPSATSSAAAR